MVYLWCPDNPDPTAYKIEVKQRDYGFDLSGRAHIHVEGLQIFAAAINMDGSSYCMIDNCHLKYPEHFKFLPLSFWGAIGANYMSGHHNEWKNSSIVHSAGSGIYDWGRYNKVTNCIIHDVVYMAQRARAAIESQAHNREYTYNTLYNSGHRIIHLRGSDVLALRIKHNDMYNNSLLSRSQVMTAWPRDGAGTVIAYNYVHDNWTHGRGISLGPYCSGYIVHRNLFWNISRKAIVLYSSSHNNELYHNTFLSSCEYAFVTPDRKEEGRDLSGTKIINNLAKAPMFFETGANALEHHHNGNYSVDADGWPTPGSGAIDAGVVIPGIIDGYVGAAPDIGCFEVGTEGWQAGANWVEPPFAWHGCPVHDFETGDFGRLTWEHSGDASWAISSAEKNSGNYSAQAGSIVDDQSTTLQVTLDCISGNIIFYRKVSSESNFDYLQFYIDGVRKRRWSGREDWTAVSFPVTAGTRTFEWTYSKDDSASGGHDTAWIDDIVFPIR